MSQFNVTNWLTVIIFLIGLLATITMINIYRLSKSSSYGFLALFMFFSLLLIFTQIDPDNAPQNIVLFGMWSNRLAWFSLVLTSFAMKEKSENQVSNKVKMSYYTFSLIVLIITFFEHQAVEQNKDWGIDTLGGIGNIISFHLNSFLGATIFTYIIWQSSAINQRAQFIRRLWIISIGGWSAFYALNFALLLFGAHNIAMIDLLYLLTTIILLYLVLFAPENLLISKDAILQACRLYAMVHTEPEPQINFGYAKIQEYLRSIPEEIWTEGCGENK